MIPKPVTYRSKRWLQAVASLDCVICGIGPSQAAHINEGKGMALKTHDCWTAALCPECHSRIDQGKDMTREERRETMRKAVLLTIAKLALDERVSVIDAREAAHEAAQDAKPRNEGGMQ